jgi:hypothetical protein
MSPSFALLVALESLRRISQASVVLDTRVIPSKSLESGRNFGGYLGVLRLPVDAELTHSQFYTGHAPAPISTSHTHFFPRNSPSW